MPKSTSTCFSQLQVCTLVVHGGRGNSCHGNTMMSVGKLFVTIAWCLLCLPHHAKSFIIAGASHLSTWPGSTLPRTELWAQSDDEEISLEAFQARKRKLEEDSKQQRDSDPPSDFDGYAMRDVILEKWGRCYDVDFNRVDSFGFKSLYLNILPFHLGGRRFRHATELDYLCHLQAVVEILVKYKQVS